MGSGEGRSPLHPKTLTTRSRSEEHGAPCPYRMYRTRYGPYPVCPKPLDKRASEELLEPEAEAELPITIAKVGAATRILIRQSEIEV